MSSLNPGQRVAAVEAAMPASGLFAEKEWRVAPHSLGLEPGLVEELGKLGHRLLLFTQACNELYHLSVTGRQPGWVADYLDRGKPAELVRLSRKREWRAEIPRVIRPDLVLTEEGFVIAELDLVPGGIGLTAWLNETDGGLGDPVLGGMRGMLDGFAGIAPGADILVSEEAATYRPEMEWVAARTGQRVCAAEDYRVPPDGESGVRRVYRFFELFDLENIAGAAGSLEAAEAGRLDVTPPVKPYLEEKLWFGLFWMRPLREYWRRALGDRNYQALQRCIPRTWILDPEPLPHHAVIPGLEVNGWDEVAGFSQKDRELVLKISGFSELGWGCRGVAVGSDLSQEAWAEALGAALAGFGRQPYILQRFHKGRRVLHPYLDRGAGRIREMEGRVRLCPYYFVLENKARLCGALATICPADKKLLHGMRDAILVPACAEPAR